MTDLFEQRLRNAARSLPTPDAPRAIIDRVLAERASGTRIILPASPPRSALRRWRSVGIIAFAAGIAALGLTLTSRATQRSSSVAAIDSVSSVERFFVQGMFPTNAFARTPPPAPGAPSVTGVDGATLGGRRFEYRIRYVDTSGRITPDGDGVVSLSEAQYEGTPAWRVTHLAHMSAASGQQRTTAETLYVTRRELRLLTRAVHEAPYRRYTQITIRQRFVGDSVVGEMSTDGGGHRPIARQLPRAFGPYLSDALAPLGLVGVRLSLDWRGSVSVVGWAVLPSDVFFPVTLSVVGEEKLSTPAGLVDCWKLRVSANPEQRTEWVRKSDGVAIRSRDESTPTAKGRREFILLNP
jgi:hypothetical protein